MEEQKKNNPQNNGQRISVRPGNFTPPPKKQENRAPGANAAATTNGANGAATANRGASTANAANTAAGSTPTAGNPHRNRPHNRRGGRQDNRNADNRNRNVAPVSKESQQSKAPQPAKTPQGTTSAEKAKNNQTTSHQPQNDARQGAQGRKNRNRRPGDAEKRNAKNNAPTLSETLQKELDEEFSTPMLASFTSQSPARKKTAETVEDTKEFEVDIATAAYLVEDIPCGFPAPDGKAVEVVGVRFRHAGKVYFFAPGGLKFAIGDSAIVDTARGPELGEIVMLNRRIAEKDIVQPLRPVLRRATAEDLERNAANHRQEAEALKICAEKIAAHKLDMRLVDAQYAFDNSKLLFYFTSEGRVDFRELVRDLAGVFHTRIELRQIGIRDEARLIGGLGMCGRPFCCATFLSDFGQVSVKMAKEQGLSINTSKISGCCGRLMCCLRYEYETYQAEARLTPKKDTPVDTPDGPGVVVESTPLSGLLKVRLDGAAEENALRVYHRDDVTPKARSAQKSASGQERAASPDAPGSGEPADKNRETTADEPAESKEAE